MLAKRLEGGANNSELIEDLVSVGVEPTDAAAWTHALLTELGRQGELAADASRCVMPEVRIDVDLGGVPIRLEFDDDDLLAEVGAAVAHLKRPADAPAIVYRVSNAGELVSFALGDNPATVVPRWMAAVWLKGMLVDQLVSSGNHLCALHAACVAGPGGAILLLGKPGAGKTTLTLRLLGHNLVYGGDDVVLVREDARVHALALAPALKQGSWPLLENFTPWKEASVHRRPDGVPVRFAPLQPGSSLCPSVVSTIISLRRRPGADVRLEALPTSDVLIEMLADARSPGVGCSVAIVEALASMVSRARCFRLHYEESTAAVPLILDVQENG